jgi:hypothetical protein
MQLDNVLIAYDMIDIDNLLPFIFYRISPDPCKPEIQDKITVQFYAYILE